MTIPGTRTTGPLSMRLAACQEELGWWLEDRGGMTALASYACDCDNLTLVQIVGSNHSTSQFAVVVTCPRDGTRHEWPYRLTPWTVAEFAMSRWAWRCSKCGEPVATARCVDGVLAGLEIDCAICAGSHSIDLSLSALPGKLRQQIFGIAEPQPILSPPVMHLLRDMWKCLQRAPQANSFTYVPYTMRYDSGRVVQPASQFGISVEASHLEQLAAAGLIIDGDSIAISDLGIARCLEEFGASGT